MLCIQIRRMVQAVLFQSLRQDTAGNLMPSDITGVFEQLVTCATGYLEFSTNMQILRTTSYLEYLHIVCVNKKVHNALLMEWRDFFRPSVKKDCEARALVYRQRGGAVDHDGTIRPGHCVQCDGHQFRPSVQAYATFKIVDYSPCPGCDRISTSEAIEPTFAHVAEWLCYHAYIDTYIDTTFVMTLNASRLFF